jgi:hypothetical protein
VSLDDALSKPIYSLDANTSDGSEEEGDKGEGPSGPKRKLQACILCPQKLFKNEKMAEDHLKSKVSQGVFATDEEDMLIDWFVIEPYSITSTVCSAIIGPG